MSASSFTEKISGRLQTVKARIKASTAGHHRRTVCRARSGAPLLHRIRALQPLHEAAGLEDWNVAFRTFSQLRNHEERPGKVECRNRHSYPDRRIDIRSS